MTTPTTTTPNNDDATASTPTSSVDWRVWYTIIIVGLTILALRHDPTALLYAIPIGWLLYFVPAWLIVKLVRAMRRK